MLPINKQAKQCPLALNQSKTSPSKSRGHCDRSQVTVLPINKQAKQCPLALNQSKTSPSMPGDTVTGHCVTDK